VSHQDRVFFSTFAAVIVALVVLAVIFFSIAQNVVDTSQVVGDSAAAAVAERIKPVGEVNVAQPGATSAARSGEQVVAAACNACHGTGAAGAPRIGDKAAWDARFAQGLDTLVKNAISGIRAMPPKGTCMDCSDDELKGAVIEMLAKTGFAVEAPAAAAAPASAAVDGEKVYNGACMACHGTGAAGAPKLGDKTAWAPRIAQGMDTLLENATSGIRAMPPKGTCMTCSDADLKAAIEFMTAKSQ
jgi:cytochrome c5